MKKSEFLKDNIDVIKDKNVLDLAAFVGRSTAIINALGAKSVCSVEVRQESINEAKKRIISDNVTILKGDITDQTLMDPLVNKADTIVFLGALYHLHNHFDFFKLILKPNVEHVIVETLFGPETLNPDMFWTFETTDHNQHGWVNDVSIMPVGSPNIAWILKVAKIFGFECDYFKIGADERELERRRDTILLSEYIKFKQDYWPQYEVIISNQPLSPKVIKDLENALLKENGTNKRMVFRLFNTQIINSTPIPIEDLYEWSDKWF